MFTLCFRIHASDEYVMDRATVFHSTYLSTCRLRQSTKSVPLGHYLLPPVSVQRGELITKSWFPTQSQCMQIIIKIRQWAHDLSQVKRIMQITDFKTGKCYRFYAWLCSEVKAKMGRFLWELDEVLGVTVSILLHMPWSLFISFGYHNIFSHILSLISCIPSINRMSEKEKKRKGMEDFLRCVSSY